MILMMLYCLEHKIKFILYSEDANFGYKNGWTDYFQPFCTEVNHFFHKKYNLREYLIVPPFTKSERVKKKYYKITHNIDLFTQDLWRFIRNREMESRHYSFPELGIDGNLIAACRTLIEFTWQYNPAVKEIIQKKIQDTHLPTEYIGLHIRAGDKFVEHNLIEPDAYIKKAESLSKLRKAFILTDDYAIIEYLEKHYPYWEFHTFCQTTERGYIHSKFQEQTKEEKKEAHYKLFASIDILSNSSLFIGTFSSNPGMYLGMRMPEGKCIGIDLEKWQIW